MEDLSSLPEKCRVRIVARTLRQSKGNEGGNLEEAEDGAAAEATSKVAKEGGDENGGSATIH